MVRNVVRGLSLAVLLTAAVTAYPHTADSQAVVNCAERSQASSCLLDNMKKSRPPSGRSTRKRSWNSMQPTAAVGH